LPENRWCYLQELLYEGNCKTVSKETYIDNCRRLRDEVGRNLPEKWITKIWFLLHGNASPHLSVSVKDFLAKKKVTTPEHPYTLLIWTQLILTVLSTGISIDGTAILWCY
jgi:hypothetical protein